MKGMLKGPLIVAAIVVAVRILLEQGGAPDWLSNLFSVVVLYLVVFPLYFAVRIAAGGADRPYRALFKTIALYTALARSMVIVTYWLAYIYQWTAPRFSAAQGGNVGEGITPLFGYLVIPFGAAVVWILASLVIGGGLGSIVVALMRRMGTGTEASARN